jgi:hypothetical protein
MAARTVWLVGAGEYSDYSIAALFSTKEAGERYVEIKNAGTLNWYTGPDEYTVFDDVPESRDYLEVTTRIRRDTRDKPWETVQPEIPGIDVADFEVDVTIAVHGVNALMDAIFVKVRGFNFERVRKVSSERTAHVVANFDLLIEQEKARLTFVPR